MQSTLLCSRNDDAAVAAPEVDKRDWGMYESKSIALMSSDDHLLKRTDARRYELRRRARASYSAARQTLCWLLNTVLSNSLENVADLCVCRWDKRKAMSPWARVRSRFELNKQTSRLAKQTE
jgi:hypothetical protein